MPFGIGKSRTCCVALAVAYSKRDTSVTANAKGAIRNFVCNVYKVMIAVIRFNKRINFIFELK